MSRYMTCFAASVAAMSCLHAYGQAENPDFSIRADFRDQTDESVGNAKFLIKSRFQQVYYGGVSRHDEYRFQVELSDLSLANRNVDVYLKDLFVDSLTADSVGFLEQTYRSDFKPDDAPDKPLPAGFPDVVNVGEVVSVFGGGTNQLLFSAPLVEEFMRGDMDHDGDVDDSDYDDLRSHFGEDGVGPAFGDITGDNHSDGDDLLKFQRNYYASGHAAVGAVGAIPEPTALTLAALSLAGFALRRRRRTR